MKNSLIALGIITTLLSSSALARSDKKADTEKSAQGTTLSDHQHIFRNDRFWHPDFQKVLKGESLKTGSEGKSVARLQNALLDMGFALPAGADGQFGGQTENALRAFQRSRGLQPSGVLDKRTMKSLDKVSPKWGQKIWQDARSARLGLHKMPTIEGKKVRAVVDISEHRLTVYDKAGKVQRVFPVASGAWGTATDLGLKVVYDKVADPSPYAWSLWPESRGMAFGTRMLDLSWYDAASGVSWDSGEELHGTYARHSLGRMASHGCVRMFNENVEWVYQNLNVGDLVLVQE